MFKLFLKSLIVFAYILSSCINLLAGQVNGFTVSNKLRYIQKSDTKNTAGEFSLSRTETALNDTYTFSNKVPVDFGVGLSQFSVNDDTGVDLPDTLQSKNVYIGVRFPMFFTSREDLFMGVDLMPSWNSASNHDFAEEAFHFNSAVSFILRKSESFILACGIWFRPGYENSAIPFFGVRYLANEKLAFNLLSSEPSISYKITDKTKLALELAFLSSEFDVTSGVKKGEVVRISDFEAGLGVEYSFTEYIKGALSAGISFDQKYEYLNAQQKIEPKNSLYIGYRFNVLF